MHKFTFKVIFVATETRWNLRTASSDWIHVHKFVFLCLCTARARQRAGLSKFGSFQNTSVCFWSPRRKQKLWGWDASVNSGGNPLPSAGLPRPRHAEPRWGPHQKVCCCSSCISCVSLSLCLSVCLCVCTRASFSLISFLKSHMEECGPPAWQWPVRMFCCS